MITTMRLAGGVLGILALVVVGAGTARADKCTGAKLKAVGKKESGLLGCQSQVAARNDTSGLSACEMNASGKFSTIFGKAGACVGDEMTCENKADDCETNVASAMTDTFPSKCEAAKRKAAGMLASGELRCYAKAAAQGLPVDTAGCIPKARNKFSAAMTKAGACPDGGSPQTLVEDNCVKPAVATDGGGMVTDVCPPTTTSTTTTTTPVTSTTSTTARVNVRDHDAAGDGQTAVGSITGGSLDTLTITTPAFSTSDAGKRILVVGAGPRVVGNNTYKLPLSTSILRIIDATTAQLADRASVAVSSAEVVWGTDDTGAIQNTIDFVAASGAGGIVDIPAGRYIVENLTLPCAKPSQCPAGRQYSYNNISLRGAGRDTTILQNINGASIHPGSTAGVLVLGERAEIPDRVSNIVISGIHFKQVINATSSDVKVLSAYAAANVEIFDSEFSDTSYECLYLHGGEKTVHWNVHDNRAENCGKGGPGAERATSALNLNGDDNVGTNNYVTDSGQGIETGGARTSFRNNTLDAALVDDGLVERAYPVSPRLGFNIGSTGSGIWNVEVTGNTVRGWSAGLSTENTIGTLDRIYISGNDFEDDFYVNLAGGRESRCPTDGSACGGTNRCSVPCPGSGTCADGTACTPGSMCPDGVACGFCHDFDVCQADGKCPGVACSAGSTCPDGSACPGGGQCPDFPDCASQPPNSVREGPETDAIVHGNSMFVGNMLKNPAGLVFGGYLGPNPSPEDAARAAAEGRESWLMQDNAIVYDQMHCTGHEEVLCQSDADCPNGLPCFLYIALYFTGPYGEDSGPFRPSTTVSRLTITGPSYAGGTCSGPPGRLQIYLGDNTARSKIILSEVTANFPWRIAQNPDRPSEDCIPPNTPYSDPP